MIHRLGDFIGSGLRCRDATLAGEVVDFVVDETDWALRYVEVRLAQGAQAPVSLLPTAAFPPLERFDGDLAACLSEQELARGHVLTGPCEALGKKVQRELHDRLHWMPDWLPGAPATPGYLHHAARAIGALLTCCGEPFSRVRDLVVDTSVWKVSALCLATAEGDPAEELHLPVSFVRGADWQRPAFDSDVRAAALACAPACEPAMTEADYLDRVRQHLARD